MLSLLKSDTIFHSSTGVYDDISSMLCESNSNGSAYPLASTGNDGHLIIEFQINHLQLKK